MRLGSARQLSWISAGLALFAGVAAAQWTVAPEASSVTMYATKQGANFSGTFAEFTATIELDEASIEAGRIVGLVRTDSIATGDDQNDTYVKSYLEVEKFPEARFVSTKIEKTGEAYRAIGELTLKNITRPAVIDFWFESRSEPSVPGRRASFAGRMTVNRFDFEIAVEVDTNWTGQDVTIDVALDLRQ